MTEIPVFEKDKRKEWQNKMYSDMGQWRFETVIAVPVRLRIGRRYAKLLEVCGVLKNDKLDRKLKILEPGCGVGSFSVILSLFGKVYSFDYSSEAIRTAKELFGDDGHITFFEGDGARPTAVPELKGEKFDFILMREFHPLTRNILGNPSPIEVVRDYHGMLKEGGVILIEHSLNIGIWRCSEHIFQTSLIVKELGAAIFNTISLDLILRFRFIFKHRGFSVLASKLLNPLIFLYCLMTRRNLSKTIVIKK